MIGRRGFAGLLAGAAIWPLAARAQSAGRVAKVGFLWPDHATAAMHDREALILEGLAAAGYRAPEHVELVTRATAGDIDRLAPLARELVGLPVDVMITGGLPSIRAAREATTRIPIVALDFETDPIVSGLIASYARPGGNVTGVFLDQPELAGKMLQLLHDCIPRLSKVAVIWDPATGLAQLQALQATAGLRKLALELLEVHDRSGYEPAFEAASRSGADGLVILGSPLLSGDMELVGNLADLALRHRLPGIARSPTFARVYSGLIAYGPGALLPWRQIGTMAGKLLRGAKAAEMPVERPTTFDLAVNLKTARALGVTVPPTPLVGADDVIE